MVMIHLLWLGHYKDQTKAEGQRGQTRIALSLVSELRKCLNQKLYFFITWA